MGVVGICFFFEPKTAYGFSAWLVGSEMWIRGNTGESRECNIDASNRKHSLRSLPNTMVAINEQSRSEQSNTFTS